MVWNVPLKYPDMNGYDRSYSIGVCIRALVCMYAMPPRIWEKSPTPASMHKNNFTSSRTVLGVYLLRA